MVPRLSIASIKPGCSSTALRIFPLRGGELIVGLQRGREVVVGNGIAGSSATARCPVSIASAVSPRSFSTPHRALITPASRGSISRARRSDCSASCSVAAITGRQNIRCCSLEIGSDRDGARTAASPRPADQLRRSPRPGRCGRLRTARWLDGNCMPSVRRAQAHFATLPLSTPSR